MRPLLIESTTATPRVTLNKESGIFRIEKISRPENVLAFYEPIISWIDEYLKTPNKETTFEFSLTYYNSATAKIICKIFNMLEAPYNNGNDIKIKWYYKETDEDILEAGEDYKSLVNIPFEIIKL